MKKINLAKGIFLSVFLLIMSVTLKSQIYSYTSSTTGAYNTIASNMAATSLTRVNGATAPGSPCSSGFSSANFSSTTTYSTSVGAIEVTLTPNSGYSLNITSFTVPIRRSGTGPVSVRLAYSTNGGSTWTDQGTNQSPNNAGCGSMATATWSVSVSGASSLKFRVFAFGASSTGGTFQLLNVSIYGSVAASGPVVDNPAVANIVDTTAKLSANLTSNGGTTITERGFVWATTTNPLAGGSGVTKVTVSGTATGAFDSTLTNLPSGTSIYFKGYVRNSTGYYYTSEVNFLTQSKEPGAYPSSFAATAISKNSIKLDWTQVAGANGYLIIQRQKLAPTAAPTDKTAYTANQVLGDGTIVGLITSGATITTTINGLTQGTRYYYTLFPFGYNGVNVETYNYRTIPTIPLATDSTLGYPPSYKSIIEGVAGSEANGISAANNVAITTGTSGTQVWKMKIKDGGPTMNDADDLPTIVTRITLNKGAKNTVASWLNSVQSVGLVDDSTGAVISTGVVSASTIIFNALNLVVADDNYRPYSVRLSLKKIAHKDRDTFQFYVDSIGTLTKTILESSQTQAFFAISDSTKNTIDVVATKLRFIAQPPITVEAGAYLTGSMQIEAVDSLNVRDIDFNGAIVLDATYGNLIAGPRTVNAVKGLAVFDTIRFNWLTAIDTLKATSGILIPAISTQFAVQASKGSDIITDGSFTYPKDIVHINYNDTNPVSLTNSLEVMSMFLRDGGNNDDNDFESTTLTSLTLNTTKSYLIRKAALFVGSTKVAQVDSFVTSGSNKQLLFTGLNIVAPDNDSLKFSIRVTFHDSAIDGDNFGFTVVAATVNAAQSQLLNANAGGAASLTSGSNNRVDVVGRKIIFLQQPTDVAEGSTQLPHPVVAAIDSFNNTDLAAYNYSVNVIGSSIFDFRAIKSAKSIANGSATFGKLVYNIPSTGVRISIKTAGIDSVVSDTFEVLNPTWFRSVKTGNWSDTLIWESTTDYGTNWYAANIAPDYSIHGQITVRTGDTVQMDGITLNDNIVDELTVEKNAVLITPQGTYNRITVADGLGTDFVLTGKLIHSNPVAGNGIDVAAPATMIVKKGGVVELAAFGDAAHWAGNTNIRFEDSSFYIHNTSIANTIGAVTMFPNATTEIPVFVIAQNYSYPGSFVNPTATLAINGLLSIDAAKTFTILGTGNRLLRNGITGSGDLVIGDASKVIITDVAQISGSGKISVNHAKALFQVGASSYTELKNNKELSTIAGNGITVAGTLNGLTNGFNGNGTATTEANSLIITAHAQGLGGLFGSTGVKTYNPTAQYIFNGSVAQTSGNTAALTARTIKVDNTFGLTLTGEVTVTDSLYIGQSNVTSSSSALLTIDKSGVIDGYSATSFINGPLNMWVDNGTAKYYPVGKTTFGPLTYNATGASAWVTLEYNNNNPNSSFDTTKRGAGIAKIAATEYWKIKSSVNTNGNVAIPYTAKSAVIGEDTLNIRVVSWNGSSWVSEGPLGRTASSNSVISDGLNNYTVFTIGIDSACAIPTAPAFTNLNVCIGNPVILNATGTGTIRWFVNNTDNQSFTAGNTVNLGVLLTDTVFYTEVKNIGCYSNRVAYPVKINAIPTAPAITGTTQLCFNTTTVLNATTGGNNNWYTTDTATTPAFVGDAFTTAPLQNDTIFYVEKEQNGCVSTTRTQVNISVRAQLLLPYSNGTDVCSGNSAIVDATANNTIRWYENNTATIPFFTGTRYVTSPLTIDSVFYVEAYDGVCASRKLAVLAHVLALPAAPVLSQAAVCVGNNTQIIATGTGTTYWYNDTVSASVNSGNAFTTAPLTTNRTYYANSFDGKCFSPKVPVTVSVFTVPGAATINLATTVPANQNTTIQTTGIAQNYEWDFGTGATPPTATGAGPHNVQWSTQGPKAVKLKMWNGNTAVACSTEVQNTIQVQPALGVQTIAGTTINVYPNPATSAVNLDITFETAQSGNVIIVDATGKAVYQTAFQLLSSINNTIDVSSFAKGLYMLKIVTNQGTSVHKIVVQ